MTLPFHRGHRRGYETDVPDDRSDAQLLARLGAADVAASDRRTVSAAQDRVWQRLIGEHPALGQPAPRRQRPTPIAAGIVTGSPRRSPLPISRRAPGGWRAAFDVAAVAVLAIGLLLSARGVGIMPNGGNPNSMMTQSAAAASPTQPLAVAEGGTNRQPGPAPRVAPTLMAATGEPRRIQGDLVLADGIVYALTALTADTFLVAGYDPATLAEVWSKEYAGTPVDLAVSGAIVSVVTRHTDGGGTLITQSATDRDDGWSVELPFEPLDVSSSADTVLVSGHRESTGTPNAGQPGDRSRLLAIEPGDGSTRWDTGLTNPAGVDPLLTDDGIYYTTANGAVKAIEPATGAPRWTSGTGGLRITSRPIASGDLVYVIRPDGVVTALDRRTGEERWGQGVRNQDLGVPPLVTTIRATDTVVPAPVMALSTGGQLLVGYVWSDADLRQFATAGVPIDPQTLELDVVAFDVVTGARLWVQRSGSPYDPVSGNLSLKLSVADDQVVIGGSSSVSARSAMTGEAIWNTPVIGTITGNLIVVDHAVVLTHNVGLAALREPVELPGTATPAATPMS